MSEISFVRDWRTADEAFWLASEEGDKAALAAFCTATDNLVKYCDQAGRNDLGKAIDEYRQALLSARDRRAGQRYRSITEAKRDLAAETNRERRQCLGAIDRLAQRTPATVDRPPAEAMAKRSTVQQRMLEKFHADPQIVVGWSQREWANHLHCSPAAVASAPAWQTVKKARALYLADRPGRDRRQGTD